MIALGWTRSLRSRNFLNDSAIERQQSSMDHIWLSVSTWVIHISFLCGIILCYNTMCSFAVVTAFTQSIFSLYFLTELLCHSSDILQFPQCRASVSSISSWDQRNSLYPEVFSQRCFTTVAEASMSKHRLRSALWKTDWIIHSQPPRQCQQQVSVCLVAVEQHPVTLHLFFLF